MFIIGENSYSIYLFLPFFVEEHPENLHIYYLFKLLINVDPVQSGNGLHALIYFGLQYLAEYIQNISVDFDGFLQILGV